MGLGSGGLKGPFVDGEGADEGTWLEGKQGPWFLSVCPHLSPPSSLWDRGGRVGRRIKREGINVHIWLIHIAVQQKLT